MNTHDYQLRILKEGRFPVGEPVALSLRGPLQRGVEALHWRSFINGNGPLGESIKVSPRWSDRGAPLVEALAVEAGASTVALPAKPLFARAARIETARLVDAGVLETGAAYGFVVTAEASGSSNTTPVFHLDDYQVTDVDQPVQGTETDSAFADSRDHTVFIEPQVLDAALGLADAAGDSETGGVLFGILQREPGGKVSLRVTHLCPAEGGKGERSSFTFTPQTWSLAQDVLSARAMGEMMVGSFHTHPDFCRNCEPERQKVCSMRRPFFSDDDVNLHESVFPAAYSVGLLASHDGGGYVTSLWGWRDGFITRRNYLTKL
jgi:proteasome lid subunit RPN8/RPN11